MREVETGVWHWEAPHPDWAGPENEAVDFGQGEHVAEGLRPLLELPVEVVLATHGGRADRTALERALA
jgi:hypothetical protein